MSTVTIEKIRKYGGGRYSVVLSDGREVQVGKINALFNWRNVQNQVFEATNRMPHRSWYPRHWRQRLTELFNDVGIEVVA